MYNCTLETFGNWCLYSIGRSDISPVTVRSLKYMYNCILPKAHVHYKLLQPWILSLVVEYPVQLYYNSIKTSLPIQSAFIWYPVHYKLLQSGLQEFWVWLSNIQYNSIPVLCLFLDWAAPDTRGRIRTTKCFICIKNIRLSCLVSVCYFPLTISLIW